VAAAKTKARLITGLFHACHAKPFREPHMRRARAPKNPATWPNGFPRIAYRASIGYAAGRQPMEGTHA
jgi:hypothetical protein